MRIRSVLLFLLMLPALILPGGSTMCLCMCPEMSAPTAAHPCCAQAAATLSGAASSEVKFVAACSECHPITVPHDQYRQTDGAPTQVFVAPPIALVFTPLFQAPPPRWESSLRWSGLHSPAPPGASRTLPLLI